MDGFVQLFADLVIDAGLDEECIYQKHFSILLRTAATLLNFTYMQRVSVPPLEVAKILPACKMIMPVSVGATTHVAEIPQQWEQIWKGNRAITDGLRPHATRHRTHPRHFPSLRPQATGVPRISSGMPCGVEGRSGGFSGPEDRILSANRTTGTMPKGC